MRHARSGVARAHRGHGRGHRALHARRDGALGLAQRDPAPGGPAGLGRGVSRRHRGARGLPALRPPRGRRRDVGPGRRPVPPGIRPDARRDGGAP